MNKFEIMRRVICGLCVWNLVLTAGFGLFLYSLNQDKFETKICNLESIPLEVIEEEF